MVVLSFFNWRNVHMCIARKRIPRDESVDKETTDAQLQNVTFISRNGSGRILKDTQKVEKRRIVKDTQKVEKRIIVKSTPCHERSCICLCMIIVDASMDGRAEAGMEDINSRVNVKTQRLKSESKMKIRREKMTTELVEMERRKMEQIIFQQQHKVEMLRQHLEEIECELHLSRAGSSPIYKEDGSFIKKLLQVCFDPTNIEESASRMINDIFQLKKGIFKDLWKSDKLGGKEEDLGKLRGFGELANNLEEDTTKSITTLKVTTDFNLADLGNLTEHGFTFIAMGHS